MTNEEKAREIKKEFEQYGCECVPNDCYDAALKMAEWKDEQHEQEKQQLIEKAVKWINDNYFEYLQPISYYEELKDSIDINAFVNDFKKAMEEQL